MKTQKDNEIITYIELPRQCSTPLKISTILEARLREFRKAKRIRRWTISK